jgi:hypothetical protein
MVWMMGGGSTMTAISAATKENFHTALAAPGRSLEIPESADVYGWLIGSWESHECSGE